MKSFIYMILLLMDADFNIVQAGTKQQATLQWVWWTSSRSDEYLTLQFVESWTFPDSDWPGDAFGRHHHHQSSVEVMVW